MNLKCRLILEDYRKQREDFVKLGDVVHAMLSDIVDDMGLTVLTVEHRVKAEKSLAGKPGSFFAVQQILNETDLFFYHVCFETRRADCIFHKLGKECLNEHIALQEIGLIVFR